MKTIPIPEKYKYRELEKNTGEFVIEPLYPGYGVTVGNAIRRVLLSSMPGSAICKFRIDGVNHEFTTIKNIQEDVMLIILNLKKIRFQLDEDVKEAKLELHAKGKKVYKASDFEKNASVTIVNPDQVIATGTSKASKFSLEVSLNHGIGYSPVEVREETDHPIGEIAIDAVYTPIKNVEMNIENVRVGSATNYDKLNIKVTTDGSLSPTRAFAQAVKIILDQVNWILGKVDERKEEKPTGEKERKGQSAKKALKQEKTLKIPKKIDELKLAKRTENGLMKNKITTLKKLLSFKKDKLAAMEGLGETSIRDVEKRLKKYGLEIKN